MKPVRMKIDIWFLILVPALCFLETPSAKSDGCGECAKIDFENCPVKDVGCKDKWIVCDFTNWAWDRPGKGSFKPRNIDPSLCTHINYVMAFVDETTHTLKLGNPKSDIDKHFYKQVTAFKAKGIKVLLVIGIYKGDTWNSMISNDSTRTIFIASVLAFLEKYNFDGVDLLFTTPACPSGIRKLGQSDKEYHSNLMKELKAALNGKYSLSVELPSGKESIESCFEMTEVCELADFVNLATYGYHGPKETGAIAPICGVNDDGVYSTVKYYIDKYKCPPSKITLGIPFYGATYTMENTTPAKFGVTASGKGSKTPFLNMEGFTTFYESCLRVKNEGWHIGFDKMNGNFIYKDKEFVSTPCVADINRKSCLIKLLNLKGANLWTMDYDDFNNMCGCGQSPLLKTLNKQLRRLKTDVNCLL